jgi:hypothetical protein
MGDDLGNARVVLRAYDELVDGLRAENAALREALELEREETKRLREIIPAVRKDGG